jgi:hypothetical protein
MSAIDDILAGIDSRQLAAALGTDEQTAMSAAAAVIPTLIGGLQANSSSGEGADSLLQALGQHADSTVGGTVDLDQIDTADGRKIVAHTLADDPQRLQAVSGLGGDLLAKLLPLLAPIVMSYLARKLGMGGSANSSGTSGGGLGDLLGGILGGGSGAGGGLGDLLGQILGGGHTSTAQAGQAPASTGSGPVFNAPDGSGGFQIPTGDAAPPDQQQPAQDSGDLLGGLLGQILGR